MTQNESKNTSHIENDTTKFWRRNDDFADRLTRDKKYLILGPKTRRKL